MKTTRLISLCLVLTAVSHSVQAGDVRLYRADETPDAREVASILARDSGGAPRIKFRSIRLLPAQTASVDPVATEPVADETRDDSAPSGLALPVQFAFDSATILPQAQRQLDAVAEGIKLAGPTTEVLIEGHTDAVGSARYNDQLSRRRADSVKAYLVQNHGIAPSRLRPVGMGMNRPFNEANPFAGENRRVEFRASPRGA